MPCNITTNASIGDGRVMVKMDSLLHIDLDLFPTQYSMGIDMD